MLSAVLRSITSPGKVYPLRGIYNLTGIFQVPSSINYALIVQTISVDQSKLGKNLTIIS